jgi:glucose/arabinose dehydrogenase
MTDFQKFPGAIPALWSSGVPTVAPSGATFINGTRWGSWNGLLAVGLLKGSRLLLFKLNAQGNVVEITTALRGYGRLRSPVQGPDGSLYITTDNGGNTDKILKVTPR